MDITDQDLQFAKETIIKMGLFSACTDDEIEQLLGGIEKQNYRQGATILFQGEISSRLYLVEDGKVAVLIRKGKDKVKVAELEPNGYFGEISLLTPRAATATIKAETDSVILFLPGEVVQRLARENTTLHETLASKIKERLDTQKPQTDAKPE